MTDPRDLPGLQALARIVDPVAERFSADGHRLYLVGGVVRDLMLGHATSSGPATFDPSDNDIDLTTDARPPEIKRLLAPIAEAIWTQGERFGTIGAIVDGHELEITTHRAEAYDPESRKPIVTFGRDLDQDLSRRDFTINAAAIELPDLVLHDPYDGIGDLAVRRLRTPLSPDVSFTDDPLRMMRAARFISRFSLAPASALVDAAAALADRLIIVSVERTADEFERLLQVDDAGPGFEFLNGTGLLSRLAPQFSTAAATPEQRALVVELGGSTAGPLVRRAGALWPIRDNARPALTHLRYSRATATVTTRLLDGLAAGLRIEADRAAGGEEPRVAVRRIASAIGADLLDSLTELAAVVAAKDPAVSLAQAERLVEVLSKLRAEEDLEDFASPLSGAEVMDVLGLGPGPDVGRAQKHLREHRLIHGPFGADEARRELQSWWRQERGGGHSLR